jgi:hypothetical protein
MLRRFRKVWPIIKAVLGLLIVAAIGRRFYLDLRDHPELTEQPLRPGWLVLSGALYLLGLGTCALFWYRLLWALGQQPALASAVRAYYIGHMGKYLPGKAWALFLRADLVRGPAVRGGLAAMTAFYEVLVTMSAGALVAAVLFALLLPPSGNRLGSGRLREQVGAILDELTKPTGVPYDWQRLRREITAPGTGELVIDRTFAVVLAVGLLAPLLIPILPPIFNRLVHHLSLPFRRPDERAPRVPLLALPEGLLLTGAGWLCLAASLGAALEGVLPEAPMWDAAGWGRLVAIMEVSYVAGFVILVLPSGLGVRELFLTMFLITALGCSSPAEEIPVVLAVLVLRGVWTLAELVMIALVWRLPGRPVFAREEGVP